MTYSILVRDPDTGELGVAVQTRWPMVGAAVPWVEAGVGAVVTQASTNVALGPRGLELLRNGRSAEQALHELIAGDPEAASRQVGVIDSAGRSAVHTGDRCVPQADHASDADISAHGNMLAAPGIPTSMVAAFRASSGDLAHRLLAALRAAESAGGDVRGAQSAALLVTPAETGSDPWSRRFDLRVDDSPAPLDELRRLLQLARAYETLSEALSAARSGDFADALGGTAAAHERAPGDAQIAFWHGVVLVVSGHADAGRSLLLSTLGEEPGLAAFAARSAEVEPSSALADALRKAARLVEP